MKKLVLLSLLSLFCLQLSAEGIRFEEGTWEEVKAKAAQLNKPIFVDVYTDWCGPCKWMAKNVFTDEAVAQYYNEHFVNYSVDAEKGEGVDFAKEYKVKFFPTLFYMDAKGEVLHQHAGALRPNLFLEVADIAMDPKRQIGGKIRQYEAGERSPEFLQDYAMSLMNAGMDGEEAFNLYFESIPKADWSGEKSWELIQRYAYTWKPMLDMPVFDYVVKHKADFPEDKVDGFIAMQANLSLSFAAQEDKVKFQEVRDRIDAMDLPNEEAMLASADMSFMRNHSSPEEYYKAADKYHKKYNWDNPMPLNNDAYTAYEKVPGNKKIMKKALKWVNRSLELDHNSATMDTKAAVLYALKMYPEALEAVKEAISMGEEEGESKEVLQPTYELMDKIKENL